MADYSLPPWLQFDPAQRINQAIQSSRRSRDEEQKTQFDQSQDSDKGEIERQKFQAQNQAAARKIVALQKYTSGLQSIPDTDPQASQKKQALLMQYGAEVGEFTPGMASMYKALSPAPTFKPDDPTGTGTPAIAQPAAPAMPQSASLTPPAMSLQAPPAAPAPPQPAPVAPAPAAAAPSPWLAPPGSFGGRHIPGVLRPTLSPYQTGELSQRAADLTEKKRQFDLNHPQDDGEAGPNVTSVDGVKYYKRGKDWTEVTGQGASKVDPQLNELLNEKKTAWSAYVNPKEGADETKLEKAYNTAATEVQKYLSEKRGSSPTATPNAPTPVSPQTPTAPAAPKGPAKVQYGSPEYEAVPAHTQYMDENGNMRWKGGPPPAAQPNADAPAPAPVANTAPTKFGKSDFDAAMKDLTPRQHQVALNAFDAALADKLGLKGEQIGASRFSTSPTNQLRSGLKAHPDARLEGITDKDASELYWKALQAAKASNP